MVNGTPISEYDQGASSSSTMKHTMSRHIYLVQRIINAQCQCTAPSNVICVFIYTLLGYQHSKHIHMATAQTQFTIRELPFSILCLSSHISMPPLLLLFSLHINKFLFIIFRLFCLHLEIILFGQHNKKKKNEWKKAEKKQTHTNKQRGKRYGSDDGHRQTFTQQQQHCCLVLIQSTQLTYLVYPNISTVRSANGDIKCCVPIMKLKVKLLHRPISLSGVFIEKSYFVDWLVGTVVFCYCSDDCSNPIPNNNIHTIYFHMNIGILRITFDSSFFLFLFFVCYSE